ncbi:coiled-coil domain-containing protein 89 [Pseudoliparis swirei]|uniref:coiled-coil domain-containing protein 89 n=1 Tax=Pseudoliparis swirei TaxID=2059687 RepID=UPI0024BEA6E2|nr:coiled-coil domain-containing protein 89 [Pseudoliparis swirei]
MATQQREEENFTKVEGNTAEHDSIRKSLEKLCGLSTEDATDTAMLRSRIDEQSGLICMLKQRADEVLLRCQALEMLNVDQEGRATDCQKELDREKKKSELLERRFMILAVNNDAIIAFMDEYKQQNAQLKLVNKQLRLENETLFSQKLHDKEVFVQKLKQDIKQLTEKYTNKDKEYRDKLSGCQSELLEQTTQHQAKDASLLDQLHDAQKQQRDAAEMHNELKMKLQKTEEEQALKTIHLRESITSLAKERDTLLYLSLERGKVIQEKQEKIQQLETKWKEEKKARAKAEDRFAQEAEAVNADVKVKWIQSALDESTLKFGKLKEDFEAFKDHSTNLLLQERELNKKLRHMMG